GLITLPVQLIAGPPAAYNTAALLGFVLSGYGTYLLAGYLIGRRDIACAVGALAAFSPFHLSKLWDGHLSWVTVQWVPFYLFFLFKALDTGRLRTAVLAGLFLALATLTSWYYGIYGFIFTCMLIAVRTPAALRQRRWRSEAAVLLTAGCVSGL